MITKFVNAYIIDGCGNTFEKGEIVAENGEIKYIGAHGFWKSPAHVTIDLSDRFIIPGIIDAHVHTMLDSSRDCIANITARTVADNTIICIDSLKHMLNDGVVCCREMGGKKGVDIAVSTAVKSGTVKGPDLIPCGQALAITGGHCWMFSKMCDGTDDIIKSVRQEILDGAKVIKFMATGGIHTPGNRVADTQFSFEELRAGIKAAHSLDVPTAAHALSSEGALNAVKAEIDSIEHGCFMHENDEIYELMLRQGTYYVPTLIAILAIANADEGCNVNKKIVEKAKMCADNHYKSFEKALMYKLPIAFGTDRGTTLNYHDQGARELVLMVEYGMSPMQAIISASKVSSELLGISDKYGTLEEGKYANFIVLDNNPLDNIHAVLGEKSVYKNGVL